MAEKARNVHLRTAIDLVHDSVSLFGSQAFRQEAVELLQLGEELIKDAKMHFTEDQKLHYAWLSNSLQHHFGMVEDLRPREEREVEQYKAARFLRGAGVNTGMPDLKTHVLLALTEAYMGVTENPIQVITTRLQCQPTDLVHMSHEQVALRFILGRPRQGETALNGQRYSSPVYSLGTVRRDVKALMAS